MGKIFIHGRSRESADIDPRARITIVGPPNVEICITSVDTGKTLIATTDSNGVVNIDGLLEGLWEVSFVDPELFTTANFKIDSLDHEVTLKYFSATVNVVYPEGSDCVCYDPNSEVTLNAADKSGNVAFNIPYAGSWIVACSDGAKGDSKEIVIETDGETQSVTLEYFTAYINVTYPEGSECSCSCDNIIIRPGDTSGSCALEISKAGLWTVECTDGTYTATKEIDIHTIGQTETVELYYGTYLFRNGDSRDDITGGWVCSAGSGNATCVVGDTLRINAVNDAEVYSDIFTNLPIDLSQYTMMLVSFKLTSLAENGSAMIGIASDPDSDSFVTFWNKDGVTDNLETEVAIDLTSVDTGHIQMSVRAGVLDVYAVKLL